MHKLKVGSDCSGIGSFLQALERIGIDYIYYQGYN